MKVVYSCVVDRGPKFLSQAKSLALSLKAVGVDPGDILINVTAPAELYRADFERLGCQVRATPFFADGKYCNKVAQLRNAPDTADFVICCDTDMLFLRNIAPDLQGKDGLVLGKTVDFDNPPIDRLRAVADLYPELHVIPEVAADLNGNPTLAGNFNGGLYILPGTHVRQFSAEWERQALTLYNDPRAVGILSEFAWHIDQISFCFALNALGLDYETLPLPFNFPLHFSVPADRVTDGAEIRILHYHDAVDENFLPSERKVVNDDVRRTVANASDHLRTLYYLDGHAHADPQIPPSKFTFLIGFHRSGTSLLASGCEALGYSVGSGPLMAASFDNPKGYYENKRLVKLNEDIQTAQESDWDDIFFSFGGQTDAAARRFLQPIGAFLEQEYLLYPHPNYLLKDPRVMQTYGVWRQAIQAIGHPAPEIVLIYRNPLECAESQLSRYRKSYVEKNEPFHFFGRDLRETLLLWYVYTIRFLATLNGERLIIVRYGDLITAPEACLTRIAEWACLPGDPDTTADWASGFLETGLRHHTRSEEDLRRAALDISYVTRLYHQLEDLAGQPQVTTAAIRAITDDHREPYADLMRFDFLGRLFTVPKQKWIHERHLRKFHGRP